MDLGLRAHLNGCSFLQYSTWGGLNSVMRQGEARACSGRRAGFQFRAGRAELARAAGSGLRDAVTSGAAMQSRRFVGAARNLLLSMRLAGGALGPRRVLSCHPRLSAVSIPACANRRAQARTLGWAGAERLCVRALVLRLDEYWGVKVVCWRRKAWRQFGGGCAGVPGRVPAVPSFLAARVP